jgi:hypothetical protein
MLMVGEPEKQEPISAETDRSCPFSLCCLLAGYLPGMFFSPEDAQSTFLRNVGKFVPADTRLVTLSSVTHMSTWYRAIMKPPPI